MTGRRHDDRGGGMSVEALILTPAIILLLGLLTAWARVAMATDAVSSAAGAAARAASIERSATAAQSAAHSVAAATLGNRQTGCDPVVSVDTTAFGFQVGQKGRITSRVTCTVDLGPLGGTRTITQVGTAPLDTYRGRQP